MQIVTDRFGDNNPINFFFFADILFHPTHISGELSYNVIGGPPALQFKYDIVSFVVDRQNIYEARLGRKFDPVFMKTQLSTVKRDIANILCDKIS